MTRSYLLIFKHVSEEVLELFLVKQRPQEYKTNMKSLNMLFLFPSEIYSRENSGNINNKLVLGFEFSDKKETATSTVQLNLIQFE